MKDWENRYRAVLDRHDSLRERYADREAAVHLSPGLKEGALVAFHGHENASTVLPQLCCGHILDGPFSTFSEDGTFSYAAYVFHESGNELRFVPLGLISFLAYPIADGRWVVYTEDSGFALGQISLSLSVGGVPVTSDDYEDVHRSALHKLSLRYGPESITDANRVKSILLDFAPEPPWCVNTLRLAVELGIVERLRTDTGQPYSLLRSALVQRLHDAGPSADRAEWAIDKWAVVLGRVSGRELDWKLLHPITRGDFAYVLDENRRRGLEKWAEKEKAHLFGPQTNYSSAQPVHSHLKAYIVPADGERGQRHFPPCTDESGKAVVIGTVVRVRDDSGRLMFSYAFADEECARVGVETLKQFHSSRKRLVELARAGALVMEIEVGGGEEGFRKFIADIAIAPIPFVVGFYDPNDSEWAQEDVDDVLQQVALTFAAKCHFVMAQVDADVPESEYDGFEDTFNGLPWFAGFVRGFCVASDQGGEIGPNEIRAITEKTIAFAAEVERCTTAVAWLYVPEESPRVRLRLLSSGRKAAEELAWEWIGGIELVITTSFDRFAEQVKALCDLNPVLWSKHSAVGAVYAPSGSSVWGELVSSCADIAEGTVRMRVDVDPDSNDGQYAVPQITDESGNNPRLIPPWVEWHVFIAAVFDYAEAPAVVFVCETPGQWRTLLDTEPSLSDVNYVFFASDPNTVLAWIAHRLPNQSVQEYELDGSDAFPISEFKDGGGYKPSALPAAIALTRKSDDLKIVDCCAAEYTLRKPDHSVFPASSEARFRKFNCGTMNDLNSAVAHFLSHAAEEIQVNYETLLQELNDELRRAGKWSEYLDSQDRMLEDGDLSFINEDPEALQAENDFVSQWAWPPSMTLEANLANAVLRMRDRLTGRAAAEGTSA